MADQPRTRGDARGRRSFVGIALPAAVRAALFRTTATLAGPLPTVKWTRKEENLHITMKFLGRVSDERLLDLKAALAARLAALSAFMVSVQDIGAFPSARHASVIWAGVDDSGGGLALIAAAVEQAAAELGIGEREDRDDRDDREAREDRTFRAHVTLGRARPVVDLGRALDLLRASSASAPAQAASFTFGSATVDEVHLYESHLSPLGSTYTLQARFPLRT